MSEICSKCGLPKELCVCEVIAKESQTIRVELIKKKFGKIYTRISGINDRDIDVKELIKNLKSKFACGGTAKDGVIELQGTHLQHVKHMLIELGFAPETIEVRGK